MLDIVIQGPIKTRSGYGELSRTIARALIKIYDESDIKIISMPWGHCSMNALNEKDPNDIPIISRILHGTQLYKKPDIFVQITIPNEFQPIGKFNIGVTAGIETNICSPKWIAGLNKMNLILATSNHVKIVFDNQYEERDSNNNIVNILKTIPPVEVLFIGVDNKVFKKEDEILKSVHDEIENIPEKFLFLYVGHWLQGQLGQDRKDTGMLIKTFLTVFRNMENSPALLLKASGATNSVVDRFDILRKIDKIRQTVVGDKLPNIYLLHGDLSPEEMNSLYNHKKVKALVSFTKGEGFGLPFLEASFAGIPIIASNWSAHTDFLSSEYCTLLPGKLTSVHKSAIWKDIIIKGAAWFTVNYQYAGEVLVDVYKNYNRYKEKSEKQRLHVLRGYTFDHMAEKLNEILKHYIPEFPKEVKLQLPKLEKIINSSNVELPIVKMPKLKKI